MIPEKEKQQIANWSRILKDDIRITLILTEDERSQAFKDFCDDLTGIAPKIKIKREKDDESKPPIIRIGSVGYQAIPTGRELEPFLSALADSDGQTQNCPLSVHKKLHQIRVPALLKVYIMPHCPFCPATVMQLLCLAAASESIKLTIIDGSFFPEKAASDNIQSAPTVLLDDQFYWTGSIQMEEIVDMILSRDPSRLSASSLKAMFEDGNALKVAGMMLDSGKIFPAFTELLVHKKWPVRLAAMVAFETIAEENYTLLHHTIPYLWDCFSTAEDTVKGDILYLLGKSGDKGIIPKLETVLNGPYGVDVKEAAEEALEALK
ncbi:MAG: thioredoxin family protein [Desulfobacteraceae bacterium]|nr:thioredoxin family protein [Desulfobacteraceae bacterium]